MELTHVFCDIGGVLGTNGWDREQRARAAERFGLDGEFERRHGELVAEWESGRITLDEYLESAVFYCPRTFTAEEITRFMLDQSEPFSDSIAVMRRLAGSGRVRLMTLNNESAELNRHRIERFGLREIFAAFLSSCWLGVRKPYHQIFERALGIADADPRNVLFIDDREQNLAPARKLDFQTLLFTGAAELERALGELGLL
ncbi:MAG TPA: HAD-IA family hydrolase [Thermoanaerobaculia bacterium]|nr:HAD-IA family hydrolase [Thermoanaerobaculia bacterium]